MSQPAVLSGLQVQGETMSATKKDAASRGWGIAGTGREFQGGTWDTCA